MIRRIGRLMKVEQATPSDLGQILNVFLSAVTKICKSDYNQQQLEVWSRSVEKRERWTKAIEQQYFLVARDGFKIIGFGSLALGDCIDFLFVHPKYAEKGVASVIYEMLEKKANSLGICHLYSNVSKTARPFFERKGFKIQHENKNVLFGVELINYRMTKALKTSKETQYSP